MHAVPLEIILDSQSEADQILRHLEQLIKKFDYVTVSDLYDLTSNLGTFEDTKVGWTNLEKVVTDRTTDGLSTVMRFPAPIKLDL